MKCPYCGREMEGGYLRSAGSMPCEWVFWLPEVYFNEHLFLPITKEKLKKEGGVYINSGGSITQEGDPVFVCRSCGKLLADISVSN